MTCCMMTCEMNHLEIEWSFVFSPDVILCGWLGWKHQLTNKLSNFWPASMKSSSLSSMVFMSLQRASTLPVCLRLSLVEQLVNRWCFGRPIFVISFPFRLHVIFLLARIVLDFDKQLLSKKIPSVKTQATALSVSLSVSLSLSVCLSVSPSLSHVA